jgi:hypothetical protein
MQIMYATKKDRVSDSEYCIMRNFEIYTGHLEKSRRL